MRRLVYIHWLGKEHGWHSLGVYWPRYSVIHGSWRRRLRFREQWKCQLKYSYPYSRSHPRHRTRQSYLRSKLSWSFFWLRNNSFDGKRGHGWRLKLVELHQHEWKSTPKRGGLHWTQLNKINLENTNVKIYVCFIEIEISWKWKIYIFFTESWHGEKRSDVSNWLRIMVQTTYTVCIYILIRYVTIIIHAQCESCQL